MIRFIAALVALSLWPTLLFSQESGARTDPVPPSADNQTGRATGLAIEEKLTSFDDNLLELRWVDRHWQLWAGNLFLKDFGLKEREAQQAFGILRQLKLNQRGTLGMPTTLAEYWLRDGAAPRTVPAGLHAVEFRNEHLQVKTTKGQWYLCDDRHTLLVFGENEKEARRALGVLQRHRFDRIVVVGSPNPTLMLFVNSKSDLAEGAGSDSSLRKQESHTSKEKSLQQAKMPQQKGRFQQPTENPLDDAPLLARTRQMAFPSAFHPKASGTVIPFNWQKAQLRQKGNTWELCTQEATLADFGVDDIGARQALAAVRHYQFTELCQIGEGPGAFRYLLVNGRLPRGLFFGVHEESVHPESVRTRFTGSDYVLEDGGRTLHSFGAHGDWAKEVESLIRENHLEHFCWVGADPDHRLTFLVKRR